MDFIQILADQRAERDALPFDTYCPRKQLQQLELDSPLAQVVIGLRRSGKTTLCHQALHNAGVAYAYVNFDDENLASLKASELNGVLKAAYVVYGDFSHVFLDEIQNIDGWELFVNRLLRQGLHVLLTGSNSHLLSEELGTHLTGRYKEIELLPLSFAEFLDFSHLPCDIQTTRGQAVCLEAYQRYALAGGLPESHRVSDRRSYMKTLYNAILFKDVTRRYNVRYPKVLASLSAVLMNNFCREINYAEISKALEVKGIHTIQNYTAYMERAFLIRLLPKFSFKPLRRHQDEKCYLLDMGMLTVFSGVTASGDNLGWRMENLVFLKLYAGRAVGGYELFYWKNGSEVDFVLTRGQRALSLIQVAYDISAPKTRQREINALLKASEKLRCDDLWLVTLTEKGTYMQDGRSVRILPVVDFLLGRNGAAEQCRAVSADAAGMG